MTVLSFAAGRRRRQARCAIRGHDFPDDDGRGTCPRCGLTVLRP